MFAIQAEKGGSILQDESQLARGHTGTHARIIALDQRHHVADTVGNRQVNRVAVFQMRIACRITHRGFIR